MERALWRGNSGRSRMVHGGCLLLNMRRREEVNRDLPTRMDLTNQP